MSRPDYGSVADDLHDALGAWASQDEDLGWPLLTFLGGIGQTLQWLSDLVRDSDDGRPGWSSAMDPDLIPAAGLDWLGQFTGVRFVDPTTEQGKRDGIKAHVNWNRGTPAAMRTAAQTTLTGNKTVNILERTSSAWTMTVVTRTSETPDAAATLKALMSQKPAGIVLTHVVSDEPIIDEGTLTIDGAANVQINSAAVGDV